MYNFARESNYKSLLLYTMLVDFWGGHCDVCMHVDFNFFLIFDAHLKCLRGQEL